MRLALGSVVAVLLGVILLASGQGMLNLLIVLRLESLGAARMVVGGAMAAYFVGQILGSLAVSRMVSFFGHIRAFSGFVAIVASAALAHGLTTQPLILAILRGLDGACYVGALAVAEGWLNDRAPSGSRGLLLSVYTTVFYLAMGGGQALAGIEEPLSQELFMIAGALLVLAVVPVTFTRAAAPRAPAPGFLGPRLTLRIAPLAGFGACGAGALFALGITLGPGFLSDHGLEGAQIGRVLAVGILVGMALQWPVGWLSDRFDRRTVMQGLVGLITLGSLVGLVAPAWGPVAVSIAVALLIGWMIPLYPLALAHLGDRLAPDRMVAGSATLLLMSASGAAASPIAGAWLMGRIGPGGLFGLASTLSAALLAFITWRRLVRDPVEDQATFQAVPRTSALVGHLDPRTEEVPRA